MKKETPRYFRRTDLLLVGAVLLLAAGGLAVYRLLAGNGPARAEIYLESELVMSVVLEAGEDRRFSVDGREQVVFRLYPDGSIAFEESDCPDKVCIRSGRLRLPGQSAACLPNGLILKIVSIDGSGGELDIVV